MDFVATGSTHRPSILVVDDDEMLRSMLVRTLDDEGYRVLEANHGAEALQLVQGLSHPLAMVLTDINMPVMDGLEFARAFRPRYPFTPILFMTGVLPEVSHGTSLREVGARLLLKPFGPEVLLEAVATTLTHGPSARRTTA